MKRWHLHTGGLSALLIVIIVLWALKAPLMGAFITRKLRVQASMLAIATRPTHSTIYHFVIFNPSGSQNPIALSAKTIRIDYSLKELFGSTTVIDQIALKDVAIDIEVYSTLKDNNWQRITKKLINAALSKQRRGRHEVLVKKLTIDNIEVAVNGNDKGGQLLGIPEKQHTDHMELNNISSGAGFPTRELLVGIFGGIHLQEYIDDLFSPGVIEDVFAPFEFF